MSSVIGCLSTAILVPVCGSSAFGALMSMPGIGPATEGLRGFELFVDSHAVAANAITAATATAYEGFLVIRTHWCTNWLSDRSFRKFSGQYWELAPRSPGRVVAGGRQLSTAVSRVQGF